MNNSKVKKISVLNKALSYAKKGLPVLPLHSVKNGKCSCKREDCQSPGKHPHTQRGVLDATTDQVRIKSWFDKWPDANVGIRTGTKSRIVVLDIDPRNGGIESVKRLIKERGKLPATLTVKTGGGGYHLYFRLQNAAMQLKNQSNLGGYSGIDFKAENGYVLAPPSIHASGEQYRFLKKKRSSSKIVPLPKSIGQLLQKPPVRKAALDEVEEKYQVGERNSRLTSLAGVLRYRGIIGKSLHRMMKTINRIMCITPVHESEVRSIVTSISRYPRTVTCPYTDTGNAERLKALFGNEIRYCRDLNGWYVWDGNRWILDQKHKVLAQTKVIARMLHHEGMQKGDEELQKFARKSEGAARRNAMVDMFKAESGIAQLPEDFDADPYLLNVLNGIIDLKTGKMRNAKRKNLITKLAPVEFNPDAECLMWEKFLARIFDNDAELIEFLQRAIGSSLTGITTDQMFFILYGGGANGKSTLLLTVQSLLGEYAMHTPTETLISNNHSSIPADIARLRGARFVTATETEAGKSLAESLIKQFTGGDPITARFLYGNFFEFFPQFKLFLATNHKPNIRGNDYAIWRRIGLIPFEVTIPKEEQDASLLDKLKGELPGILNWAIEGCRMWMEDGLQVPEVVEKYTQDYREEMDTIQRFLDDCIRSDDENEKTKAQVLYDAYRQWCEDNGERARTQTQFGTQLSEKGYRKKRSANGYFYKSIHLLSD